MVQAKQRIGFTCAYTPLALIDAAGYAPYRMLPLGDPPDQAGRVLHDNLCPHVKRILDRALHGDLPELAGVVFMNSCDTMRRLADAWMQVRPDDRVVLLDLPIFADNGAVSFFSGQLSGFWDALSDWSGESVGSGAIRKSIEKYNDLSNLLSTLRDRFQTGSISVCGREMQDILNEAATEPLSHTVVRLTELLEAPDPVSLLFDGAPVYLFGNVLPEPEAFSLFESCGIRIAGDDLCTGSRLFHSMDSVVSDNVFENLAAGILSRPACARTFDPTRPGKLADHIVTRTRACGARGVIGHTVKFCDPYLARLPIIRDALRAAGIPLLFLEGDCTLRSLGQQKTRIEAFAEMLR